MGKEMSVLTLLEGQNSETYLQYWWSTGYGPALVGTGLAVGTLGAAVWLAPAAGVAAMAVPLAGPGSVPAAAGLAAAGLAAGVSLQ